jgi:hypothetical protein
MSIIQETVDKKKLSDLELPKTPSSSAAPTLTATVVSSAVTKLRDRKLKDKPRGYGDIARAIGFSKITKSQVKEIHKAMQKKIAELTPAEIE